MSLNFHIEYTLKIFIYLGYIKYIIKVNFTFFFLVGVAPRKLFYVAHIVFQSADTGEPSATKSMAVFAVIAYTDSVTGRTICECQTPLSAKGLAGARKGESWLIS